MDSKIKTSELCITMEFCEFELCSLIFDLRQLFILSVKTHTT